jgi:uncharacterized membrane protein HdeD (DUF308 family)
MTPRRARAGTLGPVGGEVVRVVSQQIPARGRTPTPMQQLGEQIGHLWWVALVAGVVSIAMGLAVLAIDWTVTALVVFTGILLVVRGVALVLSPHYSSGQAHEHAIAGALGIVGGVVLLAWPDATLLVLAVLVGVWLAVSGGFQIVLSFARRRELPSWGLSLGIGVVELLLGIWAMRRPEVTLTLVVTVIGLWSVITGVLYCLLAFEVRRDARALASAEPRESLDVAQVTEHLDRLDRLRAGGMISPEEHARIRGEVLVLWREDDDSWTTIRLP